MGQTPYLSKNVLYKSSENKQNTQMKSLKVGRQWLPAGRSRVPGFGAFQSKERALNGKGAVIKNSPANAGDVRDTGLIPGPGRSPGGGHGNPLQYSCLGNPIDRGSWQAAVHSIVPMHARAGPRSRSLQLWSLSGPGQVSEGLQTPPPRSFKSVRIPDSAS